MIDPGPDDAGHIDAIVGASMRERVRWVLLTHTHPDHSPGTTRLVKQTGAEVLAFAKRAPTRTATSCPIGSSATATRSRAPSSASTCCTRPGHAPNHLCFLLEEERVLFTGDTVLDGMWSVVNPARGGDMAVYLQTLERLKKLRLCADLPGPRRRDRGAEGRASTSTSRTASSASSRCSSS